MRSVLLSCVGFTSATLLVLSLPVLLADDPKPRKPEADKKPDDKRSENYAKWKASFLPTCEDMAKRTNGVRLRATVEGKAGKEGQGGEIHLNWTIDYDGPRQPLSIVKPTLGNNFGQTIVEFYAEPNDRSSLHKFEWRSLDRSGPLDWGGLPKEMFVTVPKGKTASGTIAVSAARVLAFYKQHWPQKFAAMPAELYVRIHHKPSDRGDPLDAWTGDVYSPLLKVAP